MGLRVIRCEPNHQTHDEPRTKKMFHHRNRISPVAVLDSDRGPRFSSLRSEWDYALFVANRTTKPTMNRVQKKCFIIATGFHLLLFSILIVGPAFLPSDLNGITRYSLRTEPPNPR